MSYRGMGGYRAGDMRRRRRARGDLLDDLGLTTDWMNYAPETGPIDYSLSDVGSSIVPSDTGGGIWQDVTGFLSDVGLTGPAIGSGILTGVKGLLGGGSAGPGGGSGGGTSSPKAIKDAVKRALGAGGATGVYGRHRRMNPGNFRALHRAMRRLTSFEHAARRVYKFTHPRPGKSGFKFRRRRRKRC